MGRDALTSHMKGKKHKSAIELTKKCVSVAHFVKKEGDCAKESYLESGDKLLSTVQEASCSSATCDTSSKKGPLKTFLLSEQTTKAEIL